MNDRRSWTATPCIGSSGPLNWNRPWTFWNKSLACHLPCQGGEGSKIVLFQIRNLIFPCWFIFRFHVGFWVIYSSFFRVFFVKTGWMTYWNCFRSKLKRIYHHFVWKICVAPHFPGGKCPCYRWIRVQKQRRNEEKQAIHMLIRKILIDPFLHFGVVQKIGCHQLKYDAYLTRSMFSCFLESSYFDIGRKKSNSWDASWESELFLFMIFRTNQQLAREMLSTSKHLNLQSFHVGNQRNIPISMETMKANRLGHAKTLVHSRKILITILLRDLFFFTFIIHSLLLGY